MVYYQCHVGPHCGAYYSTCAVIGHFTCQMAMSLGRAGCCIVTRPFLSRRVGSGHETMSDAVVCTIYEDNVCIG